MPESFQKTLSVSEITFRIKNQLEEMFPLVAVEGELSNVRPSAAGHVYFTLKDEGASLSAVLFRGRASRLGFAPEDGQQVIAHGSISVYPQRGNYQIIVETMEIAGEGRILAMLEERKRRLAAMGWFDESRKRPLPILPKRVAVVTSPTGAALKDIMQVLGRRNSGIDVVICPTPVQGDLAAAQIAKMLRIADQHKLGDVIILGRGGGSIEDLLPFSDEEVVRAVVESETPIISAVGHEIDWALVDYAADVRAPTPSAAAEIVASSRIELMSRVTDLASNIVSSFLSRFDRARLLVDQFGPQELLRSYTFLAQPIVQENDRLREELSMGMEQRLQGARHRLELLNGVLQSCSPFEVLHRGYAIVRKTDGAVVTSAADLATGDDIRVELSRGRAKATVQEIEEK